MYEAASVVELVHAVGQFLLDNWIPLAILIAIIPVGYIALTIVQYVWLRHKISRSAGVRAPVISNTLIEAFLVAIYATYMQMTNRLFEFYNGLFWFATKENPHIVELAVGTQRILLTRDPEHIKTLLTGKFTHFGKGEMFHTAWDPFLGDSIFTTDGKQWQNSRSLIRPMFTKDRLRDLHIFQKSADTMISVLPPSGQTVDICDLFYRMTLDVTTDFLLGESVDSLNQRNNTFMRAFHDVQRTQVVLTIFAPVQGFLPKPNYFSGIRLLEKFIEPFIERALALSPEQLEEFSKTDTEFTFLHSITRFSRDPKVLRDQIFAVLIAGRDTTASTLSWAMHELSYRPEIWHKLRTEVLEQVGAENPPSYEDLKNLQYLNHTLNETLRLYPAVPYNLRACIEDSTLPGGPGQPDIATMKGDLIFYSTMAMQRRRDLYPTTSDFPDPSNFCPERWERWTPKPWQYVPFNGGPRICIGQNFALTEMAFMLVRLLQKYERVEYRGDWREQFHKTDIVGCPGKGVPVALYEPKI